MISNKTARAMVAASMAIFGTIALFVRSIPLPSAEIALWRAVLASVFIGAYLLVSRQKIDFRAIRNDLLPLLLSGMAMGVNWILLFEAYRYTTVSVATLSYYFSPVIVTAACPLLFKEKLTRKQIICFVMSTLGLVLITGLGDLSGSSSHSTGILLALGAACLYATVVLVNKFIRNVSGIHRTLLQFLAAILVLVPYVACTGGTHLASLSPVGWGMLLIVGLVHTGIAYCLYFTAIRNLRGQQVAILSYIDPLIAVLVSVLLLHERMTAVQLLGGALILGFTLYNELGEKDA